VSVARTKRRPATTHTLGLTLVAAVVVHGAVLGTVDAIGLHGFGNGQEPVALAGDAPLEKFVLLEPTCRGDAALAAAARAVTCAGPFVDADACLAEVRAALVAELAQCDPMTIVDVEFVKLTPEDIASIDPEPLLEILDAAEQLKHEQKQQELAAELVKQVEQQQQQLAKQDSQVVETAKPTVEVTPEQARFLAEYDTKVARETVARGSRHEEMIAKSRPEELPTKSEAREPSVAAPPPDRPPGENPDAPDLPGKLSMRTPGTRAPAIEPQEARVRGSYNGVAGLPGDGFQAKQGQGAIEQPRRDVDMTTGHGGAGGGAPPVPDLKPSEDVLERALGGGSVDHLEAVDSGDETALNAKRWVYATFFNRTKRQVAQNWEPAAVWRRHDPTGAVYGFKTRVTTLRVSLDARGKLARHPTVVNPSGVEVLDDEAVRAFAAAAPFPNPPDALIKDGVITFEFSFHFEIGAPKTSWRILRSM
jgi:TonB family protein